MPHFFNGSPLFNMINFAITIISVVLAWYFYVKALREKKPLYRLKTQSTIYTAFAVDKRKLEIKYNGRTVESLSMTTFSFWNAGKETIRSSDFIASSPFKLKFPSGTEIYDITTVEKNSLNGFSISPVDFEEAINIHFDFIDLHDGIVLNIFHSPLKNNNIDVTGHFIGSQPITSHRILNKYSDKTEIIYTPVNILINKKSVVLKILGFLLTIPSMILSIPFLVVAYLLDYISFPERNKTPKKYLINT